MDSLVEEGGAASFAAAAIVPLLLLPRPARFWVSSFAVTASLLIIVHHVSPGRKLLRWLLQRRSWLYKDSGEAGGLKTSSSMQLRKHVYLGALYVLSKWVTWDLQNMGRPKLFSLQDTLPSLPVPRLRRTCQGFLESIRPLLNDEEYERTAAMVADFASTGGHGERLQTALVQRASSLGIKSAWIETWWEEQFLKMRGGLPISGNWYGLDRPDTPCQSQADRAAVFIRGAMRFHRLIKQERLEPIRMMGVVPLCMWQYRRLFHTCREPGVYMDTIHTATEYADTRHLCVMCREELYTFDLYHQDGAPLTVKELRQQIETIIEKSKQRDKKGVNKQPAVGILTTEERGTWANLRRELISIDPHNAKSLRKVETSMFLLVLEGPSPKTLTEQARMSFMGSGCNRWFDKSIQIIVFEDGMASVNCERSWADAPVAAHLFGFMHDYENVVRANMKPTRYPDKQHKIVPPVMLEWRLSSKLARGIDEATQNFQKAGAATDLVCVHMRYFGKGFIKKCQLSPDAFVQMGIQLAYYRMHRRLDLICESAHTRQFYHGRTETVRAVTSDSVAFVKAMTHLDQSAAETKLHLLRRACVTHVELLKDAMNGLGIERHLLGLHQMAQELSLQPAALDAPAFHLPCRVSAAHAPAQRGPSGGFAGAEAGGYGISYLINEDNMYLHICHRRAQDESTGPGAHAFGIALEQALLDMTVLCTNKAQIARINSLETLDWTHM
mmetsp:Transcript_36433/g.89733  ORF Transcript_36433/g.89733 Transcript_36433/m.89733 type:complete len:726 (-) Transcript_36433:821-2998(-)